MLNRSSYKICSVENGNDPALTQNVRLLRDSELGGPRVTGLGHQVWFYVCLVSSRYDIAVIKPICANCVGTCVLWNFTEMGCRMLHPQHRQGDACRGFFE